MQNFYQPSVSRKKRLMVYSPRKVFYVVLTKYVLPKRMPLYILPCLYDCSSNMKDIFTDNKLEGAIPWGKRGKGEALGKLQGSKPLCV